MPVHVVGDRLRAGNKPLEAHLVVESNGGTATVIVRAEVPVKPFPGGVLAGAKSPRQVAEKAKAHPKEAAAQFENGDVAAWYKSNGWTYPVQGPPASGLAAVQQFFEALGLTPAPKVEISVKSVALSGQSRRTAALRAGSQDGGEKADLRPRHQQSAVAGSRPRQGQRPHRRPSPCPSPSVPNKPGETLTAKVTVQSNGNQRFVVPVTLQVSAGEQRLRL